VQLVVPLLSPWSESSIQPRPKAGVFFSPEIFQKFLEIFWGGLYFYTGGGCSVAVFV
jgi:hypothetical protein